MVMSAIYLVLRFVKEDVGKGTALKRREKRGLERRDLCPPRRKLLYVYNGF